MANPTTNYGWVMPTAADLVTDLPADFNTFGQGVDTSMVGLLGGTTGQILSKTSATNMAFTWTTPNPGDITGVTAGTGISGGGTSGDVTVTNSMATAFTTSGDLIQATGSGTFARLATGTSGQYLTTNGTTNSWAALSDQTPLTTKGDLFGYSTLDARIPVGTNNQVLTADSAQALGLKWATPSSKIIQVVYANTTTNVSSSSATYADTTLTATITPTLASSTVLVMVNQGGIRKDNNNYMDLKLVRATTDILQIGTALAFTNNTDINNIGTVAVDYLDSPATTAATTYKTQFISQAGAASVQVQANSSASSITLLEIGA